MTASEKYSEKPSNAHKHCYTAQKHLSGEVRALADSLADELTQIHAPQWAEETACIAELALARARVVELERALDHEIAEEKTRTVSGAQK